VRFGLDFGGGANGLRGGQTALRVNQVGCEDGVDQSRFSETSLAYGAMEGLVEDFVAGRYCLTHTNTHDVELEATLQQLALDLRGNAVKTDMAMGKNSGLLSRRCGSSGSHCGWRARI
jgi:hypothetical protein